VDGSERLVVANGSHGDILMGRRKRELGQHGDSEAGSDERTRDRDVVDLVGDLRLEAGIGAEPFEQHAVRMEPSARRGGEALGGQVGQPERAVAGERMGQREHDAVGVVCEKHLVQTLVGLAATVFRLLLHAEHDCEVEIARAQASQLFGLLDVLESDLDVGVRGFKASQGAGDERVGGCEEGAESQASALEPSDCVQFVLRGRDVSQRRLGVAQQPVSGIRDADRSRPAVDQREAELALEGRDVVRDDRLRVSELACRRREGTRPRDGVEGPQPAEIVHRLRACEDPTTCTVSIGRSQRSSCSECIGALGRCSSSAGGAG
jgi:hypothetical protein